MILDRDGVLNVDYGYVHTPERTVFVDGIFEILRAACRSGFLLIICTNQAGIARGYYSETTFLRYMDWFSGRCALEGANLDGVYYCPHHPDYGIGPYRVRCQCRKPAPGMILQAIHEHGIDRSRSMLIGDKLSDQRAGEAAGIRKSFLVHPAQGTTPDVWRLPDDERKQLCNLIERA